MAELDEMGFLKQLHTSSGRIPTEKGYRFYVDALLKEKNSEIDQIVLNDISNRLEKIKQDISNLIAETSKALALVSKYLAVVMPTKQDDLTLKMFDLIQYKKNYIICVLATEEGMVNNNIIRVEGNLSEQKIRTITTFLNVTFNGLKIKEIRKKLESPILIEMAESRKDIKIALQICIEVISSLDTENVTTQGWIAGASNLSNFVSLEQIKDIFTTIENRLLMFKLIDNMITSEGVQVFIGSENPHNSMKELSFVASTYKSKSNALGTVGVIGPTMMNYEKVILIVEHTANTLTNILSEF
jgi:heat-inducible transcriptional repressor